MIVLHSQVPTWKDLELRVFMCASASDDDTTMRQVRLRENLQQLRIKAKVVVATWQDGSSPAVDNENDADRATRVNSLLLQNSASTAVMFLHLPLPTNDTSSDYLSALSLLTENLPPVILVHGISPVTSVNL